MIPYRDENQTVRTPAITFAIIAVNVLVWLVVEKAGSTAIRPDGSISGLVASVCNLGLIPGELTRQVAPGTSFAMGNGLVCVTESGRHFTNVLTSMFLHGSWLHLIGNMWFLWIFGKGVEDSMGRTRFAVFYLLCGLAAAAVQVLAEPASVAPMVGASGAIGGVMGAYVMLYPRVRVYTFLPLGFFFTTIALPAWVMLGYWFLLQVLGTFGGENGVAVWAHVGGFAMGMILARLFARDDYIALHRAHSWQPRHLGFGRDY